MQFLAVETFLGQVFFQFCLFFFLQQDFILDCVWATGSAASAAAKTCLFVTLPHLLLN